jgi:hypothetical protein
MKAGGSGRVPAVVVRCRGRRAPTASSRRFVFEHCGEASTEELRGIPGDPERVSHPPQAAIERPEASARDQGCSEKIHVNPSEPATPESPFRDQGHCLIVGYRGDARQHPQEQQDLIATGQHAARQLPEDEVVTLGVTPLERGDKSRMRTTEVIDPDGRVDEHQRGRFERRRGGALAAGTFPPSAARRRALSRVINARRPS